ncbi:MAG: penicillin-binding protein 2 [Chloroflexi bacterium]|nr:penicillin-binding protein 2 [Chloroflexota bacterium]
MKFAVFRLIILVAFGTIAFQLFTIQISNGEQYRRLAENNRYRLLSENAPRGVIYDRNGAILARNTPTYAVAVVPADLPEDKMQLAALYGTLSQMLKIPVSTKAATKPANGSLQPPTGPGIPKGIEEIVEENRYNPFGYVVIKPNVEREIANVIEEMRVDLPGVYIVREPSRQYPFKENIAHVLGYTGGIPSDLYKQFQDRGYEINDQIGLSGVETMFEDDLRGGKGRRLVEVDANGREVRVLAEQKAAPGKNLVLTIDSYLQNAAVEALKTGLKKSKAKAGSLIAMNPNTGEILAMVSLPSYDDNLFTGGIGGDDYAALINNPDLPLFNRAISGEYPLGSVFKIVPASAALQEGVVDRTTGIVDSGVIWVPNKFYPNEPRLAQPFYGWSRQGLGLMNVVSALAWSSDIFFYEVSGGFTPDNFDGLGEKRLASYALSFGFGDRTGLGIPGEARGLVPTDRWKRLTYAQGWVTGDTYNMGIGQGFLLGTPLQLLNATAAVVNGGTLYKPQIARAVLDTDSRILRQFDPTVIRRVSVSPDNLAIVREGLRAVVTSGTATSINFAAVPVAGKTGTAEFPGPRDRYGRLPTHAWFTAFAPFDNPQIVLVAFVENGGEGSQTAVPIAGDFLKAYFHLPPDTPLAPDVVLPSSAVLNQTKPAGAGGESPQAGAIVPRKPADAPRVFSTRILAQESWTLSTAGVFGWVRDRAGRPMAGVTLKIDGGGYAEVRVATDATGWFKYDLMRPNVARDWHVAIDGVESADVLTLQIQPGVKYTVLFQEQ